MSKVRIQHDSEVSTTWEKFGNLLPGELLLYDGKVYAKIDVRQWPATEDEYVPNASPDSDIYTKDGRFVRNAVSLQDWRLFGFCAEEEVQTLGDLPKVLV
jgi:hypothetical protein